MPVTSDALNFVHHISKVSHDESLLLCFPFNPEFTYTPVSNFTGGVLQMSDLFNYMGKAVPNTYI